jgi:hypothetical protein
MYVFVRSCTHVYTYLFSQVCMYVCMYIYIYKLTSCLVMKVRVEPHNVLVPYAVVYLDLTLELIGQVCVL